ncbi:MAG: CapA family protein [Tannerella sp.]|jgi:poly-gamma-glutamate synthesis protein (capsule biosynthesis protein)|nr:CapA family protein [Tannerella sp.]
MMTNFINRKGVEINTLKDAKKLLVTLIFSLCATLLPAQSGSGDFRLVLAGDCNLHQKISIYDDPDYLAFYKRIQTADAAFLNIESQVQPELYPAPGPGSHAFRSGGIYLYSPDWILDEFKWAGFNLFSVANNHSFDYGEAGLRASVKAIHDRRLVYAGAGENLALARAPRFLDTQHGRVALIAISSTLLPGSWAGRQRADLPGRFGINPLRYQTTYTVKPETLNVLREVSLLGRPAAFRTGTGNDSPTVRLGEAVYQAGDEPSVHTQANRQDVEELLASIRDARQQADWVIVTIHAHEGSPYTKSKSADFLEDFAHKAIDEGADVFANHGPMDPRGVELYKGKPIFYGVGNFAFDGHVQPVQPEERYEQAGLPKNSINSDLWIYSEPDGTDNPIYRPWRQETRESVVYELIFSPDGKLKQIALDPISLLWAKGPDAEKKPETRAFHTRAGIPGPASPEVAKRVFERITKQSATLGTKVTVSNGRGFITLE